MRGLGFRVDDDEEDAGDDGSGKHRDHGNNGNNDKVRENENNKNQQDKMHAHAHKASMRPWTAMLLLVVAISTKRNYAALSMKRHVVPFLPG